MIPREEIIKQINRFYDILEETNNEIELNGENTDPSVLSKRFMIVNKIGADMQYSIAHLKGMLDSIEIRTKPKP